MSVTQQHIDALNLAIAKGEKVVKLDGKMIEYRSVAELISARNDLQQQLAAASVGGRPRQTRLTQSGRGY